MIAWCFRQNDHTDDQDDCPGELDTYGNAVAAGVLQMLRSIVDDRGQKKTDRDGQLIRPDDDTANPFRGSL